MYQCKWYMQYIFALIMQQISQPSTSPMLVDKLSVLANGHSKLVGCSHLVLTNLTAGCSGYTLAEAEST